MTHKARKDLNSICSATLKLASCRGVSPISMLEFVFFVCFAWHVSSSLLLLYILLYILSTEHQTLVLECNRPLHMKCFIHLLGT